jgi:hypothetical protein
MSGRLTPWLERLPGQPDTTAADLERARIELAEVSGRGLPLTEAIAEMTRLDALITELEGRPSRPFAWITRARGTEGARWDELAEDPQERRAWMQRGEFRILVVAAPGRKGAVLAEYVHTDTDETDETE